MEALGAFALAGLGYLVTKLSAGKDVESFDSGAPRGPDADPLTKATRGAAPRASPQELDLMYNTGMEQSALPSEPNPGVQGTLLNYKAPAPRTVPMNPNMQPKPEPIESATPLVAMNPSGIQAQPSYIEGFVTSELTGGRINSS